MVSINNKQVNVNAYRGRIAKKCDAYDMLTTPPCNNHWHYLVKLKIQITWSNDRNDKLRSRSERLVCIQIRLVTGSWYIRVMQAYANPSILSSYQGVKTGAMDFRCVPLLSLPTNHEYIGVILCLSTIVIIIIVIIVIIMCLRFYIY